MSVLVCASGLEGARLSVLRPNGSGARKHAVGTMPRRPKREGKRGRKLNETDGAVIDAFPSVPGADIEPGFGGTEHMQVFGAVDSGAGIGGYHHFAPRMEMNVNL